jgi:hypothetical protein
MRKVSFYDELSKGIQIVTDEYKSFLQTHKIIHASDYNIGEKYKKLTNDAIEGKALSLKKITYYVQEYTSGRSNDASLLERILSTPFHMYSNEFIVLELETGVFGFPWQDFEEKKKEIDFMTWSPTSLASWQLDKVCARIAKHTTWVKAWVHGHLIEFHGGIMAQDISFEKSLPAQCVPTVSLLLSCNTNLTRLRIAPT